MSLNISQIQSCLEEVNYGKGHYVDVVIPAKISKTGRVYRKEIQTTVWYPCECGKTRHEHFAGRPNPMLMYLKRKEAK